MDSDGEDKPEYIKDLINTMKNNPNKIIFAVEPNVLRV